MREGTVTEAAAMLREWDDVLVLSHRSPDGDTLGSAAALVDALLSMGKRAMFRCADPIPEKFFYLFRELRLDAFTPAHIVTVDVADKALLGSLEPLGEQAELAIDHHFGSHRPFAACRWVEEAAACCMMVTRLIEAMGVEITPRIADALYTGVATDTGCFKYPSVTPETHRIAAMLLEHGAHASKINTALFDTKTRTQIRLESAIYRGMEFYFDGKCAVVSLPGSLIAETGATESDLDGVSALARQVEGVVCGVTLRERGAGEYKVSLRTAEPVDAVPIARTFGGGGHKFAAGCTLHGTLEEVKARLLAACGEALGAR